jgi:hypothetical protein
MSIADLCNPPHAPVFDPIQNAVWASSFGSSTTNEEASAMAVTFDASGKAIVIAVKVSGNVAL